MSRDMSDYVEVAERIEKFYEKYPEGSLRCKEIRLETVGEETFLVYVAEAWRDQWDNAPAQGAAWEPVPGKTNFTRDSELMNAETSAWGRAIAALGFEVKRGIASANEVRNRRGTDSPAEATGPQKAAITRRCNELALTAEHKALLLKWAGGDPLTKSKASKLIELLKESKDFGDVWKRAGLPNPMPSDVPGDDTDLPPANEPDDSTLLTMED